MQADCGEFHPMNTKTLAAAALSAALGLTLAACAGPVNPTRPPPTASPTTTASEDSGEAPVVDRDPKGALPTIEFDDEGIPTMTPVPDEPPEAISVRTLQAGDGATVGENDFVSLNYAGFLWSDGSQFDSSYDTGAPAGFLLSEVVDGMSYALAGTRVGDRVLLVIPPDYGYGDLDDESIPAGSTLVFVVDVLNTTTIGTEALTGATPTGADLPAGVTVEGQLGQEPSIVFAEDAPEPTEAQVIVIAEGTGPVITESDTLLYHVAGAYWGEESTSSWSTGFEQVEAGGGEETVGRTVGSRLLLIYPADDEDELEAEALVLDLLATIPGQ